MSPRFLLLFVSLLFLRISSAQCGACESCMTGIDGCPGGHLCAAIFYDFFASACQSNTVATAPCTDVHNNNNYNGLSSYCMCNGAAGYFLSSNSNQCGVGCPQGYAGNVPTGTCDPCVAPCLTCTGDATSCTSCVPGSGLSLYGNQCVVCPSDTTSINSVCSPCVPPCATCEGATTVCSSCLPGYQHSGTQCITTCPLGTVPLNGSCVACTSPCASCVATQSTCTSCLGGMSLLEDQCLFQCPDGTFPSSGICTACTPPCKNCLSASACSSCVDGASLSGITCVTCPDGQVFVSGSCVPCDSPCSKCGGSPSQCTDCQAGYALYGSSCLCPSGQYLNEDGSCLDCPLGSFSSGAVSTCTACNDNEFTPLLPGLSFFETLSWWCGDAAGRVACFLQSHEPSHPCGASAAVSLGGCKHWLCLHNWLRVRIRRFRLFGLLL